MAFNPVLMQLAQQKSGNFEKVAVVPPGGGGAPPMDPAMTGGAPPMDPAMAAAGGMPPGAPPTDPAMAAAGGAPPMDPMAAAAGGMPGGDPAAAGAPAPKKKPEEMMQMLDFRLYNLQQQLTAIMNAMDIKLDPGVLITPPGSPTPVAEAAVQGGPQDPGQAMAPEGGGQSAISPIEPMQGASPELAAGGGMPGGGGGEKAASEKSAADFARELGAEIKGPEVVPDSTPFTTFSANSPADSAAAVAAMLRRSTS